MDYFSPLRYPGGKAKVAEFIKSLIRLNGLGDCLYIEPYAGGASVALSLMFSEYASKIIINDKDRSLFAFWHSVLNHTDELCKKITDYDVSVEGWDTQRHIQKNKNDFNLLELGFSTFYLNRVNRSGIIMAGIIGGRSQAGKWKIDARFNKQDLVKRIERIATYKDRIDLYNEDAVALIKRLQPSLPHRSFIYLDPPYFNKGSALYMNHYSAGDHAEIADYLRQIPERKWVVSYDDVTEIRSLYSEFRHAYYSINYSASQNTPKGQEVMIFSDAIGNLPQPKKEIKEGLVESILNSNPPCSPTQPSAHK